MAAIYLAMMASLPLPQQEDLFWRWRCEKVTALALPALRALCLVAIVLLGVLGFSPPSLLVISAVFYVLGACWILLLTTLAWRFLKKPRLSSVVKRADHVLQLSDELLCFSEVAPEKQEEWVRTAFDKNRERLQSIDLKKNWLIKIPRATVLTAWAAVCLTVLVLWQGWSVGRAEQEKIAAQLEDREARVAAAEDVLQDWKDFTELTEDEELKKLFSEAAHLREAIKNNDPMAAMLEMNRIEASLSKMQDTVAQESLSPQAERMAEALEAFEGMSGMSAALRNKNFAAAENEAEKLSRKLAGAPKETSALRRDAAVAEMLASESKTAANRGNQNLSDALSQMSQAAAQAGKPGSVPNDQLSSPTKALKDQFAQENSRQNRGRAMALSKEQLEALRRRLRGEEDDGAPKPPSLCQSCLGGDKPGGKKAGTAPGGDPKGEETNLAQAGVTENGQAAIGEGESETRTLSSTAGSGAQVAAGKPTAFSDYAELSQKAVADETLPLAHRRVIRTYFENIRPVAETSKP